MCAHNFLFLLIFAYFPSFVIFVFIWRDLVLHQGLKSLSLLYGKWVLYICLFCPLSLRLNSPPPISLHCIHSFSLISFLSLLSWVRSFHIILLIFSLLSVSRSWLYVPTNNYFPWNLDYYYQTIFIFCAIIFFFFFS